VGLGIVAFVLVGMLAGALYTAFGPRVKAVSVASNSVAAFDPRTGSLTGNVSVGVGPRSVAFGEGAVWVANTSDQTVSRVAAATFELGRTIAIGDYPSDVAVGAGGVWVAAGISGSLLRIDPSRNTATRATPVEGGCGGAAASVAIGAGSLWFACEPIPGLYRIDPRSRAAAPVAYGSHVASQLSDVVFGDGKVWIADRLQNRVTEIDPATNIPLRQIRVGSQPVALAVGAGSVWVANRADGTVSRISIGGTVQTIRVGGRPVAVAAGPEGVWVADAARDSLARIDPRTSRVVSTIHLSNQPVGLVLGGGRLWATVGSG
jgi:DNA-binding beta-propeller fold protein YncE